MAETAPHVAETTLNVAAGNGAIKISPKIAPTVTLKDVVEGINLNEVAAATMLDVNKVIAEEDKKMHLKHIVKPLLLKRLTMKILFIRIFLR
jgi:hypothetical protein